MSDRDIGEPSDNVQDSSSSSSGESDNPENEEPPPYESLNEAPPPPYSPSFLTTNRIFDIPEGPPDYFSIFSTRIQEARRDSNSCCEFLSKAIRAIVTLLGITILFVVLMSVPVAMLGVGATYYGQCPIEPLIPIFMVIFGLFGIVKSIETLFKHSIVILKCSWRARWRSHSRLKYLFVVWRVIDVIFNLISFGWVIAGSYWIFHVYDDLEGSGFDRELCHPVLYKFAFGIMISSFIVVGLTFCCVCGCSLCQNPPPREGEEERTNANNNDRREEAIRQSSTREDERRGQNGVEQVEMTNLSATNPEFSERVTHTFTEV